METCNRGEQLSDSLSSYRTYEEWKLQTVALAVWEAIVLTVPMRNGNFFICFVRNCGATVLTVPMRNGN